MVRKWVSALKDDFSNINGKGQCGSVTRLHSGPGNSGDWKCFPIL